MKLTHTFTIDHTDSQGERYVGTFTCKKRSIQDNARLGVRITQLNGGMHNDANNPGYGVDDNTWAINHMIATLELGLTAKPEWFDVSELVDMELLELVYAEVAKHESSFRRKPKSEPGHNASSTTRSSAQEAEANRPRENTEVVVPQIRATLEP